MGNMSMVYISQKDGNNVSSPLTDETALLVIPELGGHGIYKILREQGAPIEEAVLCVLHMQCDDRILANEILVKYGLSPLDE